jgi:hypothetical protein
MSARIHLRNDRYIKYDSWPIHINKNAHKLWAGEVIGINEEAQYPILLEWLDRKWFDNIMYYDVSNLTPGDIVRVNAGSYKKSYPTCFRIMGFFEDIIRVEKIDDILVMELFKDEKEKRIMSLRKQIMNDVRDIRELEILKEVLESVKEKLN